MKRKIRYLEIVGLGLVVLCFGLYLLKTYSLKPYSDPQTWYYYGKHFAVRFFTKGRAYGFPLIIAIAIKLVGPMKAFLVNIPVIMALLVSVYLFGRNHISRYISNTGIWPIFTGSATLALFVHINRAQLIYLVNPYRDPLSFVLVVLSMCCLVSTVHSLRHRYVYIACAAAFLALACAARDTSILLVVPFGIFMVVEKIRDNELPFWRFAAVGLLTFAIFFIPQGIQNYNISGSVAVAGQAVETGNSDMNELVPGIRWNFITQTMPRVNSFLFLKHYGVWLSALLAFGLVRAWLVKDRVVLYLLAPSAVFYWFFYAAYKYVMPRYLMVVDLYTVPIMATGLVAIVGCVGKFLCVSKPRGKHAVILVCSMFIVIAFLIVRNTKWAKDRFLISHAEIFQEDINDLIPKNALLYGDRPLAEIARCFCHAKAHVLDYVSPNRVFGDPDFNKYFKERIGDRSDVYLICSKKNYSQFLRHNWDLELIRSFKTIDYGMTDILHAERFKLYKVSPWSKCMTKKTVMVDEAGEKVIRLNLRNLSCASDRTYVKVRVNNKVVDTHPVDGLNFYYVKIRKAPSEISVQLESDVPVPSSIQLELMSLESFECDIGFVSKGSKDVGFLGRFSEGFLAKPWPRARYMTVGGSGAILLPTVKPRDDVRYIASTMVSFSSPELYDSCGFWVDVDGKDLYRSTLHQYGREPGGSWRDIAFVLNSNHVKDGNTKVTFNMAGFSPKQLKRQVYIKSLVLGRHTIKKAFKVDVGADSDRWWIVDGFAQRERIPGNERMTWRWTRGHGRVNILMERKRQPTLIKIRSFVENLPDGVSVREPEFKLNGHVLEGSSVEVVEDDVPYIDITLTAPADIISDECSLLEIISGTWVPAEEGVGKDRRTLGIRICSIEAE